MAQTDIDVDFYIHGVPTSFSSWGTGEEDNYLKKFYNSQKEDQARMFVEYQKMSYGSYHTYYNYIIDANVKGSEGRDNSYIGLTIRLKRSFCTNVRAIYQLLEFTFNTHIVGSILHRIGDSWKYNISDFRSEDATMKKIGNIVIESFKPLINSCIDINEVNSGACPKLDLYSYDENGFVEQIKKYGQFIVSPFYESLAEKRTEAECNEKIKTLNNDWTTEKTQLQQDIQKVNEEKAKLNNELEEMKKKLNNAKDENQRLTSENQKYKDSRRMEEILKSREFQDMANLLRKYAPRSGNDIPIHKPEELHPEEKTKKTMYLLEVGVVILLVISGLLGWQLIDANDMLAKERELSKNTKSELTTYKTANAELQRSSNFKRIGSDYSINIEGSSTPLKINETYTLKAVKNSKPGFWHIAGANVETKNLDKQSVTIIPKEKGQITVRYFMADEYFERNIPVE